MLCSGQRASLDDVMSVLSVAFQDSGTKELLLNRDNGWQIPESWNATLRTDMMSSTEARRPEQSVDGEAQAMEMDS